MKQSMIMFIFLLGNAILKRKWCVNYICDIFLKCVFMGSIAVDIVNLSETKMKVKLADSVTEKFPDKG